MYEHGSIMDSNHGYGLVLQNDEANKIQLIK